MSALTVNLPDGLHDKARELAAAKKLSMDVLVTFALTQYIMRSAPDPKLEERAGEGADKRIAEFLAQALSSEPCGKLPPHHK